MEIMYRVRESNSTAVNVCRIVKFIETEAPELYITEHATQHIPARFKSAQPAKDRTQLLFEQAHLLVSTKKCLFRCLLRKYRRSSR